MPEWVRKRARKEGEAPSSGALGSVCGKEKGASILCVCACVRSPAVAPRCGLPLCPLLPAPHSARSRDPFMHSSPFSLLFSLSPKLSVAPMFPLLAYTAPSQSTASIFHSSSFSSLVLPQAHGLARLPDKSRGHTHAERERERDLVEDRKKREDPGRGRCNDSSAETAKGKETHRRRGGCPPAAGSGGRLEDSTRTWGCTCDPATPFRKKGRKQQ